MEAAASKSQLGPANDGQVGPACELARELERKDVECGEIRQTIVYRDVLAGHGRCNASEMTDSSYLFQSGDWRALYDRLQQDGYLLVRGLIPRQTVLSARRFICQKLSDADLLCDGEDIMVAQARDPSISPGLLSRQDIAHSPNVLEVLENASLVSFFQHLFSVMEGKDDPVPVWTSPFKWLRAVPKGFFTGFHVDRVYMGRGSDSLTTAWIPLGDITVEDGALVVCRGSHCSKQLEKLRHEYGRGTAGQDGTSSGWVADRPEILERKYGVLPWTTTNFQAGDVCVINLDVLHVSSTNVTSRYRLSCDTRWQPFHHPRDPRLDIRISRTPTRRSPQENCTRKQSRTSQASVA